MTDRWQSAFADSVVSLEELLATFPHSPDEAAALAGVAARYPFRLTRHYFDLITVKGDPIWRQAAPDPLELDDDQSADPLAENSLSPVPGLIHRYPDRVVWLVNNSCAVYCRFCMRKRQVGCPAGFSGQHHADALHYIRRTPTIRDVILSGGDPLLLDNERLEELLAGLRRIPHVDIIRIGTRLPVTFPARIDESLCAMLRRYHPIYLNTHFNHPIELTAASRQACAMLADCGIQLGNQTVLLAGINDDPAVMTELCRGLLSCRVKPYYLHQMDLVQGTGHFRTPVATGLQLMAALRGHVSGLAVPYYVIDLPGGKGKVPLLPGQQILPHGELLLENYCGEKLVYKDLPG